MSTSSQRTPLIPSNKDAPNEQIPAAASRLVTGCVTALGVLRIGVGAACIIAPQFTCNLFRLPASPQIALVTRLTGVRDIVLGELLLTANRSGEDKHHELKRTLWANVATDVVDVGSCAVALYTGAVGRTAAGLFGGGAVLFVLLGVESLVGLRKKTEI